MVQELEAHPDPVALAPIQGAIREAWIKPASAAASHLLNVLLLHLDRGEAEGIALAADLKADVVLLDEQEGRQLAAEAGLFVTGVLGILLRAKESGHITALKPQIQSLRNKARFFIAPLLEAKLLAARESNKGVFLPKAPFPSLAEVQARFLELRELQ